MKRLRNIGKLAAIAFSSLVALGYIYDRAGGNVFPGWFFGAARSRATQESPTPATVAGEKSSPLLPGSKSKVIAVPAAPAGQNTTPPVKLFPGSKSAVIAPAASPPPATAKTLLPGSKSLVIAPNSTGQSQAGGQQTAPQHSLLPGSKSSVLVQPLAPAVDSPPTKPEAQLLPGSKSDVIVK